MVLVEAWKQVVLQRYAQFSGRAGRAEYWWFVLSYVVVTLVLNVLHLDIIALLVNLALLVPSLAAGTRRLHDIGKSGWFQLIWLIPFIGWILLIYWLAQPSTGPNEYGEGPAPADAPTAMPPVA